MLVCSCDLDLDLDPMLLTYELKLGIILEMYLHTKNEASRSMVSEVKPSVVTCEIE